MISILVAAYNAAPYIREAVDSALAQSEASVEVIVADDGSTDQTLEILRSYGPQITCIAAPHRNASAARNTAWRASRGEFVAILDADDRLRPHAFDAKLDVLRREPDVGVAYGDALGIDEKGDPVGPILCRERLTAADNPLAPLMSGNFFLVHAALTRRSAIERLPYLYHEEIELVGDWDLWLRLAGVTKFAYAGDLSVEYRSHARMSTKTVLSEKSLRQTLNTLRRGFEVPGADALPPRVRDAALLRMLITALRLGSPEDLADLRRVMARPGGASPLVKALAALSRAPGAAACAGSLINAALRTRRRFAPRSA